MHLLLHLRAKLHFMKLRFFVPLVLLTLGLTLFSCKKDKSVLMESGLNGAWINPVYNDSLIVFNRSESVPKNNYAIIFFKNNNLIERKNGSWCGTPPIVYEDFKGTYTERDGIVRMVVPFWGGMMETKWKIEMLDDKYLKVKVLSNKEIPLIY